MRYVTAKNALDLREQAYRIYVTDTLKVVYGLTIRYADLVSYEKEEDRTEDEIKNKIKSGLKKFGGDK